MAEFIPIGEPANDAEREGFRLLRDHLPDHYLVLGNFDLRLPQRRNSLEFDAVVIGEYGFFGVEIKGWTGDIEGGDRQWRLPWGQTANPLTFLERKTKALAHLIRSRTGELAEDCFYDTAIMFPRPQVRFNLPDSLMRSIVGPDGVYDYFVDMELVREKGPGPLRERRASQQIVDAIVAFAEPSEDGVFLSYYNIEGELDSGEFPYREYVGTHEYLQSRSKVRLKAYVMDSLAPKSVRRQQHNRVVRDVEALDVLDDNPYVARSYEMQPDYTDGLIFYLISEWVGPKTLGDYIEEFDEDEDEDDDRRLHLAYHLIEAVASIHELGIVHRNLHPGVIYLNDTDQPSAVPLKIADFDFARVTELDSIADALSHIGTRGYKAPEMWLENDYDHRVDIFSLGAIIYELLTTKMLFSGPGTLLDAQEAWKTLGKRIEDERIRDVIGGLVDADVDRRTTAMDEARTLFGRLAGH